MKKILYLFVGLMFTIKGYGQTYQPIPTDSVWWVEELEAYDGDPCLHHYYRYIYSTPNTVLIGANTYHEFRFNGFIEHTPIGPPPVGGCPASSSYSNEFYALIRNDSTNKKVYIYDSSDTHQEILLYDFDLGLGDTVVPVNSQGPLSTFFYCTSDTFTITNIDSVPVGIEYRRRLEVSSPTHTSYLIEGIGSNMGFAQKIYCPFEQTTKVHCYHYKNLNYVTEFDNGHCSQTLTIDNEQPITQHLIHRLNNAEFEIINPEFADLNITCYDLLGKPILNKHFHESGFMSLLEIPAGVYVMYIEYNGQNLKPYKFVLTQ